MRRIVISSFAAMACVAASAVPAKPTPVTITQPDGSKINVTIRGDERCHWYTTEDGYVLLGKADTLVYATVDAAGRLVPSAFMAQAKRTLGAEAFLASVNKNAVAEALNRRIASSPRLMLEQRRRAAAPLRAPEDSYGIGLTPGASYPSKGSPKAAVILVEYSDVKFNIDDPKGYFTRLLNEPGFSDYGGTGSALDYFTQNSKGQFTPQFDLLGPVTLPQRQRYYGANDAYGNDMHPEEMAIDACRILDDTVDFSQYDTNGDGKIDNVFIFYAGRGEADGGSTNTVWPHSWDIAAGTGKTYMFDGVQLDHYACSNEWTGSRPDGVGTFVHEFSHVMGLPDLYATDYSTSFTPGGYSALDYGPYNNDGCTPPNYGAFERNALGWMRPEIITESTGSATLPSIDENKAYMIPTSKASEFFLLENRRQTGWDAFIPGHGMLIWHIDYDSYAWYDNSVNNKASHQCVDIEEADGTQNENSRAGDTWPGTANRTEFTKDTRPALRTWSNVGIEPGIRNITERNGVITFTVGDASAEEPGKVTALDVDVADITSSSFVARWASDPLATAYRIEVTDAGGNSPEGWKLADVGNVTSVKVTGLQPATEYSFKVWAVNGGTVGPESNSVSVTTSDPTIDFFTTVAMDAADVTDASFTARWEALAQADNYLLTVRKEGLSAAKTDTVDFANDLVLPAGWTTDAMFVYKVGHCGAAPSALRFTGDGYVQSPVYDEEITAYSLWFSGVDATESARLLVKGYVPAANAWVDLATHPVADEGVTVGSEAVHEGVCRLRIEYRKGSGKECLALDDIIVSYGGAAAEYQTLPGYADLRVGNVTSHTVSGLEAETAYVYTVQAVGGSLMAKCSSPVRVVTAKKGSAGIVAPQAVAYALNGRTLTAAEPVEVYAIDGRHVAHGTSIALAPGIYILRTPAAVAKIVVR